MLRKYRYLALGIMVMLLVVAACLLLPGFLLNLEGQRDVGTVTRATQEYNADNVSAGDSVDFNLQTRLLMLSGQWQCRDTVIREDEVYEGDQIVPSDDMFFYGANLFLLLTQLVANDNLGMNRMADAVNRLDEEAKDYITTIVGEGWREELENMPAESNMAEEYGTPWDAIIANTFFNVFMTSAYDDCTYTLHRYEDQILDTYYFYVWEYSIKNDMLGYEFDIMMDAVTMEVYSVRIQGSLFESIPWNDLMREVSASLGDVEDDGSEESMWMHYYIDLPQDLVLFYYMNLWPMVLDQVACETELFPLGMPNIGVSPRTEEQGYNFVEGNFFISRSVYFSAPDGIRDTLARDDFENQICICMDEIEEQGFEWYLSVSP